MENLNNNLVRLIFSYFPLGKAYKLGMSGEKGKCLIRESSKKAKYPVNIDNFFFSKFNLLSFIGAKQVHFLVLNRFKFKDFPSFEAFLKENDIIIGSFYVEYSDSCFVLDKKVSLKELSDFSINKDSLLKWNRHLKEACFKGEIAEIEMLQLRKLRLTQMKVNLARIFELFPNLEELSIEDSEILNTPSCLENAVYLSRVSLENVTLRTTKPFTTLLNLKRLAINRHQLSSSVSPFTQKLESVAINAGKDSLFANLKTVCPEISKQKLNWFTKNILSLENSSLSRVSITYFRIGDALVDKLSSLPLVKMDIRGNLITSLSIPTIKKISTLRFLDVSDNLLPQEEESIIHSSYKA